MAESDLDYARVTGRFGITVGDTDDEGENPDIIWITQGRLLLTPRQTFTKVAAATPSPATLGQGVIECTFVDGYLTYRGLPRVYVVDLTSPKVNPVIGPDLATHRVTILDARAADGTAVTFPPYDVRLTAAGADGDGVNDLTLLAPVVPGESTPITRGPQGTSVQTLAVQAGDLVATFDDGTEVNAGALPVGPGGSDEGVASYLAGASTQSRAALDQAAADLLDTPGSVFATRQSASTDARVDQNFDIATDDGGVLKTFVQDYVVTNDLGTSDGQTTTLLGDVTSESRKQVESIIRRPLPPPYAGTTRAKTWNPSLCLYNGESPTLRTIRSLVRRGRAGTRVRAAFAGDSKTAGSGAAQPQVASNSYPGQFADLLGAKPGMIYANTWDTRWGSRDNVVDVGGTSQNYYTCTDTWSVTFTSLDAFTGFKVYAYISPGGGINVTVDGVPQAVFAVGSGSQWKSATYSGLSDTTHTITLSGSVGASVLGVEPVYASGLTVSNAGRPSSSAAEWLYTTDWSRLYASTFAVGNNQITRPDFAVINIGTNTNTSTLADINNFLTNVASLTSPAVPTLIAAFGGVESGGAYDAKRDQLYDTADALDLPLVDFTALIGDSNAATAKGLMADTVHENARGYAVEADLVARVLAY